jgi:hypothetical protein
VAFDLLSQFVLWHDRAEYIQMTWVWTTALVERARALNAMGWTRSEISQTIGYPKALMTLWLPDEQPGIARQQAQFLRAMESEDPHQPGMHGEGTFP